MLLKTPVIVPFFTVIPAKSKPPFLSRSLTANALTEQSPEAVRRNASTNKTTTALPSLLLLPKLPPTSAYIHLPFCRKRCHYCDFPVIALGSISTSDDPRISNYVEILCREIEATNLNSTNIPPLETVFFGGGTPSFVPPKSVSSVLDALSSKFGVWDNAEISMEMDPGTFDAVAIKKFMKLGVNRVSLGVQAFQQELLKACGRAHSA